MGPLAGSPQTPLMLSCVSDAFCRRESRQALAGRLNLTLGRSEGEEVTPNFSFAVVII